jgi:hypothetical protein
MNPRGHLQQFTSSVFAIVAISSLAPINPARAQDRYQPAGSRRVVARSVAACACEEAPALGTFEPTPYVMVRGSWPTGGGYSPLQIFGDQSMSLYGPLSPLRSVSAPITTYTRGYDGRVFANRATTFSTPNLPSLSHVVYPTPANYYYGPRVNRTPPSWSSGMNWIDQQ